MKILEDGLHMDRKILSSAHLMLVQSRWVEENAMDSTIKILTRLLLDLRCRYKWFEPLTPWMIDLIAHYCVLNTSDSIPLPLDQAYKRFFKILSAGFFLPRSAGIIGKMKFSFKISISTVPCKKTRDFAHFPYKLAIFE